MQRLPAARKGVLGAQHGRPDAQEAWEPRRHDGSAKIQPILSELLDRYNHNYINPKPCLKKISPLVRAMPAKSRLARNTFLIQKQFVLNTLFKAIQKTQMQNTQKKEQQQKKARKQKIHDTNNK